jgi:hypothetical protein
MKISNYRKLVIAAVLRVPSKSAGAKHSYIVNVTGQGCRFCLNVGRDHKSNRVYFTINSDGFRQCCHDPSDMLEADMQQGLCKDYGKSRDHKPLFPLVGKLNTLLYGSDEGLSISQPQVDLEDDENEELADAPETARQLARDRTMRNLMTAANQLAQDVFHVSYTTSSRFLQLFKVKLVSTRQTDRLNFLKRHLQAYNMFEPDSIGLRDKKSLQQLGLLVEDEERIKAAAKERAAIVTLPIVRAQLDAIIKNILRLAFDQDEQRVVKVLLSKREKRPFDALLPSKKFKKGTEKLSINAQKLESLDIR